MVEFDMEAIEVLFAARSDACYEFLRRDALFLGSDHHRGTMSVVRSDEVNGMTVHSLRPNPDVGLNIFHDVADMEMPIGIRQGGRYEYLTFLHNEMSRKMTG